MASFVDWDKRGLYSINDLTEAEVLAIADAIETAHLPNKRLVDGLVTKIRLATMPF